MARSYSIAILLFVSLCVTNPLQGLDKRAKCPANGQIASAKNCLYSPSTDYATSYCSSYLGITTVTKTKTTPTKPEPQHGDRGYCNGYEVHPDNYCNSILTCPPPFTFGANGNAPGKRQAAPASTPPACLSSYGLGQIGPACENCVAPQTPTSTVTEYATPTLLVTSTVKATATSLITTTQVVTSASSTPASFYVYYTDLASSTHYATVTNAPEGTPQALAFASPTAGPLGTVFSANGGNAIFNKLREDIHPFIYLDDPSVAGSPLVCSTCTGFTCNYPGETGDVFAICDGFLTLGLLGNFTAASPDSSVGTLGVKDAAMPS